MICNILVTLSLCQLHAAMANWSNRNIVEKYICHKLFKRGYEWVFDDEEEEDSANNG